MHPSMLVTPLGELVTLTGLEYYLSDMSLVHDGGQETPIEWGLRAGRRVRG